MQKKKTFILQDHYDIKPSEDGLTYTFVTKSNVSYLLALITYSLGDIQAFSLSFYPKNMNDIPKGFDYRIKWTVIEIIGKILKEESNSLFYVCDIEGDKRQLIFDYWYKKAAHFHEYVGKYNHSTVSENGYVINSSLLYNLHNPLADYIISKFIEEMTIM